MQPSEVVSARKRNGRVEVFIKWDGLPVEDASWEPLSLIRDKFPDLHLGDKVIVDEGGNDTVPIRVYERKRRKGNKGVHPDDETGLISCPGIADLDK